LPTPSPPLLSVPNRRHSYLGCTLAPPQRPRRCQAPSPARATPRPATPSVEGSGTAVVPLTIKNCSAVVVPAPLRYQVPLLLLALQFTTRKVTVVVSGTFCRAEIPERLIADCELPLLVVLPPQVIAEPMSAKVVPSVEYCHWPVVGPLPDRRTL